MLPAFQISQLKLQVLKGQKLKCTTGSLLSHMTHTVALTFIRHSN